MSEEEDDIILSELDDDDLVAQMFDDLYDGLKEEIEEGVTILLDRGWTPYDILTKALVGGMTIVGNDFRDGILFVPEVLMAANAMKGGMAILKPLLVETGAPRVGKMVIGTVKGDIHDIGKNLVSMMMEGAGFEVVDLGINNAVESLSRSAGNRTARHPRHVRAADHDDALHEGRDRHAGRKGHPRRLHRAGGRRAAERRIRPRHRCRRLLPGCRRGGGNGQGIRRAQAQPDGRARLTLLASGVPQVGASRAGAKACPSVQCPFRSILASPDAAADLMLRRIRTCSTHQPDPALTRISCRPASAHRPRRGGRSGDRNVLGHRLPPSRQATAMVDQRAWRGGPVAAAGSPRDWWRPCGAGGRAPWPAPKSG
jgi:hypothetical protein